MSKNTQPDNSSVYHYGFHTAVPYQYVNGQVVYMVWNIDRKVWVLPKAKRV